jgi:hypothetical protein
MKTTLIGRFVDWNRLHPKVDVAIALPTAVFKKFRLVIPFIINASGFATHYNSQS